MWSNEYIGIPYKRYGDTVEGCDCWGLVSLIYKNMLNITLPDLPTDYHIDRQKTYEHESLKWNKIERVKPFDVIAFKYGRIIGHVGIIIDDHHFLHVQDDIMSCVESYRTEPYSRRIAGVYRWN